ncbi:MAG: putative transrane protein, partial [Mucilaginibacter sp.]|nr:putative transrane protein [Mucilaginibacter sp.]
MWRQKLNNPRTLLLAMLMASAALGTIFLSASAAAAEFSFGVIGQSFVHNSGEPALHNALAESDEDNLAFVVVNGIKSASEPCTDQLYTRRRSMLEDAQNGIIMSLAAGDWVTCKNNAGRSTAIERLNQIRELFYDSDMSFGASKLDLIRQSASPKFREYAENARWEIGDVLFATVNLPVNNNHYRS